MTFRPISRYCNRTGRQKTPELRTLRFGNAGQFHWLSFPYGIQIKTSFLGLLLPVCEMWPLYSTSAGFLSALSHILAPNSTKSLFLNAVHLLCDSPIHPHKQNSTTVTKSELLLPQNLFSPPYVPLDFSPLLLLFPICPSTSADVLTSKGYSDSKAWSAPPSIFYSMSLPLHLHQTAYATLFVPGVMVILCEGCFTKEKVLSSSNNTTHTQKKDIMLRLETAKVGKV